MYTTYHEYVTPDADAAEVSVRMLNPIVLETIEAVGAAIPKTVKVCSNGFYDFIYFMDSTTSRWSRIDIHY